MNLEILKRGIDVSYAQGAIDWAKVRAAGTGFAIIRAGYGSMDYGEDKRFAENAAGCAAAGIPFGLYHYSYARSADSARDEAAAFLARIKGLRPEYPLWLDFEERIQTRLPPSAQMDVIEAFLSAVEEAGYYAGLYSCRDVIDALAAACPARLAKYDLWAAGWGGKDGCTRAHGMWQYSASGEVAGINGPVDLDAAYCDYPALIRAAGKNGLSQAAAAPSSGGGVDPASGESAAAQPETASIAAERDRLADKLARISGIIAE